MSEEKKIKLFLVDDDAVFLKSLEIEFKSNAEYSIECFSTGEECLNSISNNPEFIILDYQLDGIVKNAMNGMQVLDEVKLYNPDLPVIILSAQDKIEVAVDCMHHKAADYVVKSETAFTRIESIIKNILEHQKIQQKLKWYMERM